MKMEEADPSETLVPIYHTPWRHSAGDADLHSHRCQKLRSHINKWRFELLTHCFMSLPPKMAVTIFCTKHLFLCGHIHSQFIIILRETLPEGNQTPERQTNRSLNPASPIKKL
jgi:hypothetical protein